MHIFQGVENYKNAKTDVVLTIGNFDGVHRGHAMLFKKLKEIADSTYPTLAINFKNHPAEILRPDQPLHLLCTLSHRLQLIEACGIDNLILMPFTSYLAHHSALDFIERLRQIIPFNHLVLGYDATLGRDRQGNPQLMQTLSEQWGFQLHYMEEYRYEGRPISSSIIRELLKEGNLVSVKNLLARPFSIYSQLVPMEGKSGSYSLLIRQLCLPPDDRYAVQIKIKQEIVEGVALVINSPENPQLYIEFKDSEMDVANDCVEVIFVNNI